MYLREKSTQQCLSNLVEHPSYTPDLAPTTFLFPKLKVEQYAEENGLGINPKETERQVLSREAEDILSSHPGLTFLEKERGKKDETIR